MKIIITGTTGMVGEGVLLECLAHPQITEVLSVSRRPTGITHPKLKEYIVPDFLRLKEHDERLKGYDGNHRVTYEKDCQVRMQFSC